MGSHYSKCFILHTLYAESNTEYLFCSLHILAGIVIKGCLRKTTLFFSRPEQDHLFRLMSRGWPKSKTSQHIFTQIVKQHIFCIYSYILPWFLSTSHEQWRKCNLLGLGEQDWPFVISGTPTKTTECNLWLEKWLRMRKQQLRQKKIARLVSGACCLLYSRKNCDCLFNLTICISR